jgi:predicted alpha/beta hydrolase
MTAEQPVEIICHDGVRLGGHFWPSHKGKPLGRVIINPATGVLARYYHRYARFLTEHGFDVLTYDYRGIGASRPEKLRGCGHRWHDWGEFDFDAALTFLRSKGEDAPLLVVGHSIGGFLPGFAAGASKVERMLTVGAQYAYWRDYARSHRASLFLKWHVVMPAITALYGYFPGRRLGWLEDLPAGVANEWSFRRARMELSHPAGERQSVISRFNAVTAQILAISVSDDEFGTPEAVGRALRYYGNADKAEVTLTPQDYGLDKIGHFDLFHARHQAGFWLDTLLWLRDGVNPWPGRPFTSASAPQPHLRLRQDAMMSEDESA